MGRFCSIQVTNKKCIYHYKNTKIMNGRTKIFVGCILIITLILVFLICGFTWIYYSSEIPVDFRIDSVMLRRICLDDSAFCDKTLYLLSTKGHPVNKEHRLGAFPDYPDGSADTLLDIKILSSTGRRINDSFIPLIPSSYDNDNTEFIIQDGENRIGARVCRSIESQKSALQEGWTRISGIENYCVIVFKDSLELPSVISIVFPDRTISAHVNNDPKAFKIIK